MANKKFENVIYYKCKCNDKIHTMAFGEKKEVQILSTSYLDKIKCPQCMTVIKIVDKELLTIENNKITKEKM